MKIIVIVGTLLVVTLIIFASPFLLKYFLNKNPDIFIDVYATPDYYTVDKYDVGKKKGRLKALIFEEYSDNFLMHQKGIGKLSYENNIHAELSKHITNNKDILIEISGEKNSIESVMKHLAGLAKLPNVTIRVFQLQDLRL